MRMVSEVIEANEGESDRNLQGRKEIGQRAKSSPILIMIWRFDAPKARSTSLSSGSTVARPVATFTRIGKNEIRKAVMIAGTVPMPNQITRMGTTATFELH